MQLELILAEVAPVAPAAPAAPTDVIGQVLQWGVPGVIIILLLVGWLVPKGSHEQMKTDRDHWQAAYEKERDAHAVTRDALVDANRAAGTAIETARTTTALLSSLGHVPHPRGDS